METRGREINEEQVEISIDDDLSDLVPQSEKTTNYHIGLDTIARSQLR